MFPSPLGARIIQSVVDEFMGVRERYAPSHTIRREFIDGLMSSTVIDRGTDLLLREMQLSASNRGAMKAVVSNLMKLLYNLEGRRFETGRNTDGHDLLEGVKQQYTSYCVSEMMKEAAAHHGHLSMWDHTEARQASKRLAEVMFDQFGHAHGVPRASRW